MPSRRSRFKTDNVAKEATRQSLSGRRNAGVVDASDFGAAAMRPQRKHCEAPSQPIEIICKIVGDSMSSQRKPGEARNSPANDTPKALSPRCRPPPRKSRRPAPHNLASMRSQRRTARLEVAAASRLALPTASAGNAGSHGRWPPSTRCFHDVKQPIEREQFPPARALAAWSTACLHCAAMRRTRRRLFLYHDRGVPIQGCWWCNTCGKHGLR